MAFTLIALADSVERRSLERSVAQAAICVAAERFDLTGAVFDLPDIGPSLTLTAGFCDLSYFSRAAIEAIRGADALILTGSAKTGRFSPLFQQLLRVIGSDVLAQKPVLSTPLRVTAPDYTADQSYTGALLRWLEKTVQRQGLSAARAVRPAASIRVA